MAKTKNEKKDQDLKRIKFEVGQEMGIFGLAKSKPPEKENKNS
ncbi:MAG: hypothetical protein ACOX0F_08070 [Syntrophomonadaceae bacterium]|jgi:hypothetical protein